jgi:hypothetical protein
VRVAFLMYFVVSLIAVPCADWLAELMRSAAGAGDFRDGAYVLESLVDGSIATLILPVGFGALVLFPLATPLRMTWLAAIRHPKWTLRKQVGLGLRRTPASVGGYLLLLVLGIFFLGLLALSAWLVHASFEGDPNPRRAALWTFLALLPLFTTGIFLLSTLDLVSAASLQTGPFDSLRKAGAKALRALPAYVLYSIVCVGTLAAGASLEAAPWLLLPTLQALVFMRYLARSFWLREALARMTTPANHAMQAP